MCYSLNVSIHLINLLKCSFTTSGSIIMTSFTITSFFTLLPLNIFVMYKLLHQWLQNPAKSTSHSDVFTFYMVIIGLINVLASFLICVGLYSCMLQLLDVVLNIYVVIFYGELFFHLLTCLDRYLAVAKPITYLSLRSDKGIRIRNIIIGCVLLLCFPSLLLNLIGEIIITYCIIVPIFMTITFFNISILFILIRPLPGDNRRPKAHQSKMKAFYTILIVMAVLVLKFGWDLISGRLVFLIQPEWEMRCGMMMSTLWTTLPSSLALPLIFLYKKRKLIFQKNKN